MTVGIINLNKPRGITSFSAVARVRKLTGARRAGHAGTLDPLADGVLPICLGRATRIVEYLVSQPKAYRATVRLGSATDTYDSEGAVTATADASGVSLEAVERALATFAGEIDQLPPMYSALKHQGQPLYRYARAGKEAPRQPRRVRIYRLDLLAYRPPLVEISVEVGRGAYIRTLAHDLGELLGCHAHLEQLTRTRTGPFRIEEAVELAAFEAAVADSTWEELLRPADFVLEAWHAALLGDAHSKEAGQGRQLLLEAARPELLSLPIDTPCRAYSDEGEFLAILRYRGSGRWQPEKVFASVS